MKPILILGGGFQAISTSHSLIGFADSILVSNDPIALQGRYFKKKYNLDIDASDEVINELIRIIKDNLVSVLIPMGDVQADFLSRHKNRIESETNSKCAVQDYELLSKVADKSSLMEICEQYGIPHPITQSIKSSDDDVSKIPFPALIKPNHSVGARGITLVKDCTEFKDNVNRIIDDYGPVTLQEYIDNKDFYYNVMMYRDKSGRLHNTVITKIIRYYPTGGGSSSYCYTVHDEKMEGICKQLLDKLNWIGFADFDVLEKKPGEYRIIEINPRVPASLGAAENAGVHFPQIIVADILGEEIPVFKYQINRPLRFLGLDIAWFIASEKRFKCKPSWFNFFQKGLHYQEGGIKEYRAFAYSLWFGIFKFIKKTKHP